MKLLPSNKNKCVERQTSGQRERQTMDIGRKNESKLVKDRKKYKERKIE